MYVRYKKNLIHIYIYKTHVHVFSKISIYLSNLILSNLILSYRILSYLIYLSMYIISICINMYQGL